jgi:hypothetical protein
MASTLEISVSPESALTADTQATQRLYARVTYTQQLPNPSEPEGSLPAPASISAELDVNGEASLTVDDGAPDTSATVRIETAQGLQLASEAARFPDENQTSAFTYTVPVTTYRAIGAAAKPADIRQLARSGRFIRFDDTLPDFGAHRLYVAPIRPEQAAGGGTNPQTAAARSLLGLQGSGDLTDYEVVVLDVAAADPADANALGMMQSPVRADGSFDFSYGVSGDEVGWFWILAGPTTYAGYQADPAEPAAGSLLRSVTIVLPPTGPTGSSGGAGSGGSTGAGTDLTGAAGDGAGARPPLNFDEQQLLDNPSEFSDDPGSQCSPFSNPQRILGDRPFFTVLRVDQPELGAEASLRLGRPTVLDLAPPIRVSALMSSFGHAGQIDTGGPVPLTHRLADSDLALSHSFRIAATTAASAQPAIDARAVIQAQLYQPIMAFWWQWLLTRTRQRAPVSPRNPIEWDGDPTIYQAGSVAGGHILEHRVQWRSNGYSLGDVAHTLTLAPRQSRRIAKVSWRRQEAAVRQEATTARDQVSQATLRDRDYSDAVSSSLSEWAKGGSTSSTTGAAGGIGFALGPVVIGGGAAHGQASSDSWQSGGRRVAASEQQSLRDAIRQFGDSLRQLQSTVVTELSQEEEVEGVSEVVRNINYCHALTVIYHEILRHYRVDTSFAGVRECLFVPFSVTPFDVNKALKWRDKLRDGMLARDLRWALDRLDEVANGWVDSDIPPGPRGSHPVTYLTGSAYIKLSIERPRDREEEEKIEDYRALWTRISPLLGLSVSAVIAQMEQQNRNNDAFFQSEIATGIAARWADRLTFSVGSTVVDAADFTLASPYRYGGTVRVDFSIPINGAFTRTDLQQVLLKSDDPLSEGSSADLVRMQLHYWTDHFDNTAEAAQTTNDLIKPQTGDPDPQGAVTRFPLTAWELQDLRRVIEDAVDQLIVHLNANLVYYHKVIWWLYDRDELYMLLDGFTAPYGRRLENGVWVEDTGRSIASVVEREPLGILGNSLVLRVAGGVFLGIDGHQSPAELFNYYYDGDVRPEPLRVSLPTEGLYAQGLMDPCGACEEHYGSTDWVLTNAEPGLESLVDQLGTRRAEPAGTTPTQLPETLINLQNAPAAPDPTGLAGILQAVTNAGAFRDMAGLAGTQANAAAALSQAASLATGFGQMAVDFQKSKQGTVDAKQKLSNIQKAKDTGLIDDGEAKRQASDALAEQNMSAASQPLTDTPPINSALEKAGSTGQPIEVTRQNQTGTETVKVGASGATVIPASLTTTGPVQATKLPTRSGNQPKQAWENLAPIAPRTVGNCTEGLKSLGTLLFVHDSETEIDFRGYGKNTDADAWILVHTVSDLIEGLRAYVGNCGFVTGIHINAHGGWDTDGGFRMGDDDNHNGHIEQKEANDMVSSAAQATKFGTIIKGALATGGGSFVSISACDSTGPNDAFIKALHGATGGIVIGSVSSCRTGATFWRSNPFWEAEKGRHQVNTDGTIKVNTKEEGEGIWKPF